MSECKPRNKAEKQLQSLEEQGKVSDRSPGRSGLECGTLRGAAHSKERTHEMTQHMQAGSCELVKKQEVKLQSRAVDFVYLGVGNSVLKALGKC